MYLKIKRNLTSLIILLSICFVLTANIKAQEQVTEEQIAEAVNLVRQNRYIDALPLLEKIALAFPNNGEIWADYGIAVVMNAVTINDAAERKKEMEVGIKVLQRAKKLGTENTRALYFLDEFEDFDGTDNFSNANTEVEKALREGEAHFGRGEYDLAFKAYEKAHKLDPKNYEAVLFMGDCFYAQKKYKEAEVYFEKAVKINPEMESGYRFWGDALLYQEKHEAALEKFLDALLVAPFSRMTWDSLGRWAEKTDAKYEPIAVAPPGNESFGSIEIKSNLLKADDGTKFWSHYDETIKKQMTAKSAAGNTDFSLADETAAWKNVADNFRKAMKKGDVKYPDQNLINLLKLDDENLIEPYILLLRPRENFGEDFVAYSKEKPAKIKQFVRMYILNLEK